MSRFFFLLLLHGDISLEAILQLMLLNFFMLL
jgi:hypothetical protein